MFVSADSCRDVPVCCAAAEPPLRRVKSGLALAARPSGAAWVGMLEEVAGSGVGRGQGACQGRGSVAEVEGDWDCFVALDPCFPLIVEGHRVSNGCAHRSSGKTGAGLAGQGVGGFCFAGFAASGGAAET
jgi:hypothetical protein